MSEYEQLAKNVIRKTLRIQPQENVIVECWNHGLAAAREILYQVRAVGAKPMFLFEDEETYWRSVETLPKAKLGRVSRSEWAALDAAEAYVFIPGPADIARYRKNMDKMGAATGYNSDWYKRARRAGIRGARILLGYVSMERAQTYGFEYDPWRSMILDAASADFTAISRKGRKVADLLSRDAAVEVTAPNGTNLTFELKGRAAKSDDGVVDPGDLKAGDFMVNVPPGSAYVAPDEASGEGVLHADLPLPYLGTMARGIRLDFAGGKARWTAESGADAIRAQFEKATGAKDRLGAISIGLNPSARTGYLQDDLVAGVVEVSIGDNEEWGGKNRSNFSFSARLSQATVRVGKKTLVEAGRLSI